MQVKLVQNPKVVWHWLPEEPDRDCVITALRKKNPEGYEIADYPYTVEHGLNTYKKSDGTYFVIYAMTWQQANIVAWTYDKEIYKVEVIE